MAPGAGWLNRGEAGKGIHSRWYPETLAKRIESIHALRNKITIIQGDGLETLKKFSSTPNTAAFIDPPYVAKGKGAGLRLYTHYDVDCQKLFAAVSNFTGPVIVTYHRSEVVQREAKAVGLECRSVSMHTAHTVAKRQLMIYKPGQNGKRGCQENGVRLQRADKESCEEHKQPG